MTHHLIRAAILTGFAMLIVYLNQTDQLNLYIAPRMELYIKLSAVGLYAAAIYQVYAALQVRLDKHGKDCDCGHEHSSSIFKNIMIYGLFIFPLLLGFLVPTGTLGSALASKKGISFTGNSTGLITSASTASPSPSPPTKEQEITVAASIDHLFPYDEYTESNAAYGKQLYTQSLISVPEELFIETLTTLNMYQDALVGKEVEITGFVYREEDMGKDRFAVSRFVMNCCSADALPYGLMISWPKAMDYVEDEWVTVTGKLSTSTYLDNKILTLEATKLVRVKKPESPYVYPDINF
ncbi:TIGR03943 family protein [Paenibacillus sp. MCAF9]|uniref:TIGR03943 family putative permease subunit n=1 Tax=Paenibacillus sp. MCAF9 TaxID=3233046 RepID=UPI003F9E7278